MRGMTKLRIANRLFGSQFQAELITDAEKWMEMVEKRNMASHAYNSVILKETVDFIYNEFYPSVKKLYEDLKKRI